VKKVYSNGKPETDLRVFAVLPNGSMPLVTQTKVSEVSTPQDGATRSKKTITTIETTIPSTSTITSVSENTLNPPVSSKVSTSKTTLSVPSPLTSKNFIRYKVISEEGDFKYIRIL